MVTEELLSYISTQTQQGVNQEVVKNILIQNGWAEQDIIEAFSIFNARSRSSDFVRMSPSEQANDAYMQKTVEQSCANIRIIFGFIWIVNAYLKWQPSFSTSFLDFITAAASGQPVWLIPWFRFWITFVLVNPPLFAFAIAATETYLAFAIILGFAQKFTYLIGIVLSLFIWTIPEGFGGLYTRPSVDIGAAIIYVLVFLLLMIINRSMGPNRFSLDSLIKKKISWWHYISDV